MKRPDGFMLYYDRLVCLQDLSFEEIGKVFCAVWDYAKTGATPDLPQGLMMAWRILRHNIDDGIIRFNEQCVTNRYNRYRAEVKKKGKETNSDDKSEWWAKQPDYTPELFKKETWYDEAAAAYQRLSALVNGGQRPSTVATNPSHSPIPGPGPNPSPGPDPNPNQTIEDGAAAVERGERMKQFGQNLKQKTREENYRSIVGPPATPTPRQ